MEQTLVFKKLTTGTVVFEAATDEDSLWGLTRSFYLNKVALGARDAAIPTRIKITVEILATAEPEPATTEA